MNTHDETPGERAVKSELKHLKLNFIQEKRIFNLKGDTKKFRDADFYLPEEDIYIEFLGNWNTNNEHKQRYKEKRRVYELNNIKCIWIYPDQLTHTNKIIQEGLLEYGVRFSKPKEPQEPKTHHESESKVRQYSPMKKRFIKQSLFILFILILVIFVVKNFEDNNKSLTIDEPDEKYKEIYSKLGLGMDAKHFWNLVFTEGFEWTPALGETKEFELFRFPPDKDRIKVYFDEIAQKEVESTGMILSPKSNVKTVTFTNAKIIKIELYYNDKIISEK